MAKHQSPGGQKPYDEVSSKSTSDEKAADSKKSGTISPVTVSPPDLAASVMEEDNIGDDLATVSKSSDSSSIVTMAINCQEMVTSVDGVMTSPVAVDETSQ